MVGKSQSMFSLVQFLVFLLLFLEGSLPSFAVVAHPTVEQQREALEKGQSAAQAKIPPSQLYWKFGSSQDLAPHGFIITKLGGLTVLSAHFSFRGATPSSEDINRIMKHSLLEVSVTVFGGFPEFAVDSYIILKQGDRLIKPTTVRSDARAHRSVAWPNDPPYKAKIVGSFSYGTFDTLLPTIVSVFPGDGGEVSFDLDFSSIP